MPPTSSLPALVFDRSKDAPPSPPPPDVRLRQEQPATRVSPWRGRLSPWPVTRRQDARAVRAAALPGEPRVAGPAVRGPRVLPGAVEAPRRSDRFGDEKDQALEALAESLPGLAQAERAVPGGDAATCVVMPVGVGVITDQDLADLSTILLFAGHETTAK